MKRRHHLCDSSHRPGRLITAVGIGVFVANVLTIDRECPSVEEAKTSAPLMTMWNSVKKNKIY